MNQGIDFEIIWKKMHKEASEQEEILLDQWLNEHPSHRKFYDCALDYYTNGTRFTNSPAELKKALHSIYCKSGIRTSFPTKKIIAITSIAASIVVVIFLYFNKTETSQKVLIDQNVQSIVHGTQKAILVLDDGTEHTLSAGHSSIIASDGTQIRNSGNKIEYINTSGVGSELKYNTLKVPRGGEYFLVLSDCTKVWLNSETTLRYPVQFASDERNVELTGEAYFEVSRNESKPFFVSSGDQKIKVLGTQFNISSYPDNQSIYTTLVEGKVEILEPGHPEVKIVLKPSEQGILNTIDHQVQKRNVDVKQYIAWKEGRFVFYDQTLEEIMNTLSKWYDIQSVFTNEKSKKIKFTGNLKRTDEFDAILSKIEKTEEVQFEIQNKTITIK